MITLLCVYCIKMPQQLHAAMVVSDMVLIAMVMHAEPDDNPCGHLSAFERFSIIQPGLAWCSLDVTRNSDLPGECTASLSPGRPFQYQACTMCCGPMWSHVHVLAYQSSVPAWRGCFVMSLSRVRSDITYDWSVIPGRPLVRSEVMH